jgi:hypothetical protein
LVYPQVVVFQRTGAVHVYSVVPYARRFLRTLVWANDATYCLHSGAVTLNVDQAQPRHVVGSSGTGCAEALTPSLVITRNLLKEIGLQTYMPARLVHLIGHGP